MKKVLFVTLRCCDSAVFNAYNGTKSVIMLRVEEFVNVFTASISWWAGVYKPLKITYNSNLQDLFLKMHL